MKPTQNERQKIMARGAIKNVSMVKTADSEQGTKWDFEVEQAEFLNPYDAEKKTGVWGVFRRDTNQYVGQYKGLKVLPYTRLVNTFEESLDKAGIVPQSKSFITTMNGGRFWGRYDIGNGVHVGNDGFKRIITLQGSYNGSLKHGYSVEMERLACLNGMVIMEQVFAMFEKCSANNDLEFISTDMPTVLENGTQYALQSVERMGNITLNDDKARNIVSNIVDMGKLRGVSPKTGHLIFNNWRNPTQDEKPLGDTLYRLYNAATRLTRDIANVGRFEMSRKANVFVSGAFDLAVRRDTDLAKLLATPANPLDFDAVTVSNN